ncbi:DUF221-domain-containing protein, partial [Aureobasidium melanogenum]
MGWIRNASPEVVGQSRYLMVISVCAVSVPLMTLIVILRGYHCLRINKNGRLSYYNLCLYTAFAVVYIVLAIIQTRLGLGLPFDLLPKANLELYTLLGYVENLAYILAKAAYNLALGFAALEYNCAQTRDTSDTHMDPNTIAIGNGSAQQDYGNSFDGFLASIQVGAFVAAVQIGGFIILRRRYRGKWNIRSSYTIFYDLDSSCLDAIGLFALLRLLTRTFGLTAIFMVPLLVPLNYVHRHSDSSIYGLGKFSCLNILEGNTGRLWTHLAAAYWFTGLFCLLSRRELADFVDIRHMHDSGTASRFYLVTDIPNRLEKALMESMFHKLYACQVRLHTTGDNKTPFVDGQPYLRALTQIEKEACREEHKKEISNRTRQRLVRCFQRMQEYLTKPYVEYDFSSLAILKIFEADSAIVRDVMPQTIWPLHTYPVSEALDCINWLNARKPRAQRTVINIIMTVFSLGLSVVLALPVTFSASLGQIEDLTQNISWLYWVNRIPPRALAYLQGAVPQLLVAAVVALVPSLLRYLSSWHCHVTHAQAEIAYYRYYSAFLFLQAFLLVSISSSLMVTLSEVLNKPSAIPRVLALNLPKAGNYFISFLTLQGFSLFADMIAQWAYLLKRTFKSRFLSSTPR